MPTPCTKASFPNQVHTACMHEQHCPEKMQSVTHCARFTKSTNELNTVIHHFAESHLVQQSQVRLHVSRARVDCSRVKQSQGRLQQSRPKSSRAMIECSRVKQNSVGSLNYTPSPSVFSVGEALFIVVMVILCQPRSWASPVFFCSSVCVQYNTPKLFPFHVLYLILNANQRAKMGEVWEQG